MVPASVLFVHIKIVLNTISIQNQVQRGEERKEWRCAVVGHHDNVGTTIQEWEKQGWQLPSYNTACISEGLAAIVNHYLFFTRGE